MKRLINQINDMSKKASKFSLSFSYGKIESHIEIPINIAPIIIETILDKLDSLDVKYTYKGEKSNE